MITKVGNSWKIPSVHLQRNPDLKDGLQEAIHHFDLEGVMGHYDSRFTPINYRPLSHEESREVAERIQADTQGNIEVLFVNGRTQVWQYDSRFMIQSHHKQPPYIVFLKSHHPIIAKPLFDRYAPIHHTSEATGTALLRELGAQTYNVVKGQEFEYLEILPGDTIYDFMQNTDPMQLYGNRELLTKIHFLCGIAIAEAFVLSMGDRNSNIIINSKKLEDYGFWAVVNHYDLGFQTIANIDTATTFDPIFLNRPELLLFSFLAHMNTLLREDVIATPEVLMVKDPFISQSFLQGFYYRYNSLKIAFERGEICRERISSIIDAADLQDPDAKKESIFSRLSYSDDQMNNIMHRAIMTLASHHVERGELALVPIVPTE